MKAILSLNKNKIALDLNAIYGNILVRIILYGSVAKNTYTAESDIDIAILLNTNCKKEYEVIASASKLREKSDYVDFYIASRQESEEQIEKAKDFLMVIEEYLVENKII